MMLKALELQPGSRGLEVKLPTCSGSSYGTISVMTVMRTVDTPDGKIVVRPHQRPSRVGLD